MCEIFALTPALSPRERGPLGATLGYTVKEEMIATNHHWIPAFAGMTGRYIWDEGAIGGCHWRRSQRRAGYKYHHWIAERRATKVGSRFRGNDG